MSPARRRPTQQFALWLALAAVLLRALLPDGFMPERGASGVALQFCYASPLAKLRATQGPPAGEHAGHGACAFAAAAAPGLPGTCISLPAFALAAQASIAQQAPALLARFSGGRPPARAPPVIS